jgi:hypothetical protein
MNPGICWLAEPMVECINKLGLQANQFLAIIILQNGFKISATRKPQISALENSPLFIYS